MILNGHISRTLIKDLDRKTRKDYINLKNHLLYPWPTDTFLNVSCGKRRANQTLAMHHPTQRKARLTVALRAIAVMRMGD